MTGGCFKTEDQMGSHGPLIHAWLNSIVCWYTKLQKMLMCFSCQYAIEPQTRDILTVYITVCWHLLPNMAETYYSTN